MSGNEDIINSGHPNVEEQFSSSPNSFRSRGGRRDIPSSRPMNRQDKSSLNGGQQKTRKPNSHGNTGSRGRGRMKPDSTYQVLNNSF
jgi:hypothetical protein